MLQSVPQNYKSIFLFQNLAQIYVFSPTFGQDFFSPLFIKHKKYRSNQQDKCYKVVPLQVHIAEYEDGEDGEDCKRDNLLNHF